MIRSLTLLLISAMLAFSLTACGGGNETAQGGTQNDSAVVGGDAADNGGNSNSSTNSGSNNGSANSGSNNGSANSGSGMTGGANGGDSLLEDAGDAINDGLQGAENAIDDMTGSNNTNRTGTSYGQMLRNGRVHDKDGDLTDLENPATPGTTF